MKGLLWKNFYSNKMYKYLFVVIITAYFAIIFNQNHDYTYLFWLPLLMFIDFRINVINERKTKWNVIVKTLPVSNKEIIISQYASFLFNIVLSVIVFTFVNICYQLSSELNMMLLLNDALILLTMDIFLQSIACLILNSTIDKHSYIIFTIVNAILLVSFIFRGSEFALSNFMFTTFGFICMFVSLIFYIASLFISIKLYNKYARHIIEANE